MLRDSACVPPWNNATMAASVQNCHGDFKKNANTLIPT